MATSNADLKMRIDTLRHKILAYKPGKAVPCDDERVVFPDKLVIGMIDLSRRVPDTVPAMIRRALHGDVEPNKRADKRQTSTENQAGNQEEYLTESVSLIIHLPGPIQELMSALLAQVPKVRQGFQHLAGAGKAGCVVLLVDPLRIKYSPKWITAIKEITGHDPLCGVFNIGRREDIEKANHELKNHGITGIYELSINDDILSDEEQLQWLDLLHGCLCEADVVVLRRIPAYQQNCKQERKDAKEAKKRHEEKIRKQEEEKRLLQRRITDLEQELIGSRASRESIVSENASLNDTMSVEQERRKKNEKAMTENEKKTKQVMDMYKQREVELEEKLKSKDLRIETLAENLQRTEKTTSLKVKRLVTENEETTKKLESKEQHVNTLKEMLDEKEKNETILKQQFEELKKKKEEDRARGEEEKCSLAAEMTSKLESKQQHVDTLKERIEEKERNETIMKQQFEGLEKGRKEDRSISEKEKHSLAAEMTSKLESKQQHVDTLKERLQEKERNETTLRQHVEELKKGREGDRVRFEEAKQSIKLCWMTKLENKKQRMEQLERETWKLRTKIQLDSEMRSNGKKKKAKKHKWRLFRRKISRKQAQGGTASSEDNSAGGLERSDTSQAGEELPDDEFAGILKQIADALYGEARIDSLGGQLGIPQGDIQRALMTNVKFNHVTSDGTRHMLKEWRRGVSREDERMELRNALLAAKLVNLAYLYLGEGMTGTAVATTERTMTRAPATPTVATIAAEGAAYLPIHDGLQAAGVPTLSRMSSEVTADFDGILKKIAEGLHKNSDIDDLGSALGFDSADIDRYIKTNAQQGGNYMGTVDMLRTWRTKQTGSAEKAALRSALLKARFVNLVDQYLSTGNAEEAVVASKHSNRERKNLDNGKRYADEPTAKDKAGREVQPDFQEPDSAHNIDENDVIFEVRDGKKEEDDQASQSPHSKGHGLTITIYGEFRRTCRR